LVTKGVLEQVLFNTSKVHFSPLLGNIIKMLSDNPRDLGIDLLQSCCFIKGGSKITDWGKLKGQLIDLVATDGLESQKLCFLAATVVSKADTITSKDLAEKLFQSFEHERGQKIGVFCQLVGKLNPTYFQKWVLEHFVK
jgi:hypothetical protein